MSRPADPFSDRNALDANPFADPAVQGALNDSSRMYSGGDDDVGSTYKSSTVDDMPSRSDANRAEELRRHVQRVLSE